MPPHGTITRYTTHACRCDDCRLANMRTKKRWRLATRTVNVNGVEVPALPVRVPVEPVREHVAALIASGWTKTALARETGRSLQSFSNVLYRNRGKGTKRINRDIAARILALEPLRPVDLDAVVVERLVAGADWRALRATRAERLAAFEAARRAGESGNAARRRLGLAGRDTAVREAS